MYMHVTCNGMTGHVHAYNRIIILVSVTRNNHVTGIQNIHVIVNHVTCDCLICTPLGFIICTRGVASDNPRSSCPDLDVDDQSAQRIFPWRSEYSRSLNIVVALLLIGSRGPSCCSWAPLSFYYVYLFILYFCIFWWCNIPVISYHSLW